jgi:hypothetical protein
MSNPSASTYPDLAHLDELVAKMRHVRQAHDVELQVLREWKAEIGVYTNRIQFLADMLLDEIRYLKRLEDNPVAPEPVAPVVEEPVVEEPVVEEPVVEEPEPVAPVPFRVALDDLIQFVSGNTKQKDALMRLKLRHADDQMYFVNFERVNVTRGTARQKAVIGKFTILGAVGARGERSCYTVSISDPGRIDAEGRTFDCDCPAHRFQRGGSYAACKHICFVLCRVVGYVSEPFFMNYRLDEAEVKMILDQMSASREDILQSVEANRHSSQIAMGGGAGAGEPSHLIRRSDFLTSKRSLEKVECPICFELVVEGDGRVNCPDCENHVHKECMEIWLTRNNTCVYCRSSKWRYFDDCVNHGRTLVMVDDSSSDDDSD